MLPIEPLSEGFTYASAFMLGLLGNVHCVAMCGGIVAAFSAPRELAVAGKAGAGPRAAAGPLPYNIGRIGSYAVAGSVAGAFGLAIAGALGATGVLLLRGLFGALLVAVGLYLAGYGRVLGVLERIGGPVFRTLSRAIPGLQPADRIWKALLLGAIWGWLPCGLVYGALLGAISSGSAVQGALLMICFGIGTLPGLLAAGALAARLRGVLTRRGIRSAAGAAVALFGIWTLAGAVLGHAHFSHRAGQTDHSAHEMPAEPGGVQQETSPHMHPNPVHPKHAVSDSD
jgi:sulfite exporter TauE/SafE